MTASPLPAPHFSLPPGTARRMFSPCGIRAAGLAFSVLLAASPAGAQDYDPLAERAGQRGSVIREELPPSAALEEKARGVVREELDPVMAADGSGLPHEVWSGLSPEQLATAIASIALPPRSPALSALWRRVIAAEQAPPTGAGDSSRFTALRVEALDQSGLIDEVAATLAKDPAAGQNPLLMALTARSEIGLGNSERGCEIAAGLRGRQGELPRPIQADVLLIAGYCAAADGDTAGAGLQAGLLRELDGGGLAGADLLDAVAAGLAPTLPTGTKLTLLDYRIGALKGGFERGALIAAASPGLLAGLAQDPHAAPDVRLAAGEAAAMLGILPAQDLAPLYRADGAGGDAGTIERAGLFKSIEGERTPLRKARLIRAFLDDARRAGLYWPALQLMAGPTREVEPLPEVGWFAETAIEVNLVSGHSEGVRTWARAGAALGASSLDGSQPLAHWVALADIVDPAAGHDRSRSLGPVEQMALGGRFDPALLHRLATVLDALDMNVPLPLWDLASRSPQPAGGHLPDTGVLSELADASRKKEFARTVLLVLRTIGPAGADGAHMIALGDGLRALKRAGLDAEARQLALEGLFTAWPRAVSP